MTKCRDCGRTFLTGDVILYNALGCHCADRKNCFNRRKNMSNINIKITAEVDGKQVPLHTVSTETFEAIKALTKPKEIPVPVARYATLLSYHTEPRLIIKPTHSIHFEAEKVYVLDLTNGQLRASWLPGEDQRWMRKYQNITIL